MSELSLHFEVAGGSGADLEEAASALEERLVELPAVEKAEAVPTGDARFTGAEVIAGIAVGIAILKGGSELVEVLRKLIEGVKKLRGEFSTKAKEPEEQASAQAGPDQAGSQPSVSEQPMAGQPVTNIIQITNVVVDIGFRSVPLSDLTEDDLLELARRLETA